jgi:pilus assembly protein CpaE
MIKHAQQVAVAEPLGAHDSPPTAPEAPAIDEHIAPAPRVSVQAFCETVETAAAVQSAGEDRRMVKAHLWIQMGGATAAAEAYRSSPTPNVILIESESRADDILGNLDSLAEVCDPGTRVVVVGRINDVSFYRELTKRGVSDYLIAPVGTIDIVRAVCGLFSQPDTKPVGRVVAVVGAKGGVGASTVAHNVAFAIARDLALDAVVTDLDLAFGTAGLDFNQDPPQGIADAVFSPDRVDIGFVDRLLSKCTDHLSLLAAPATLDRVYDFGADAFDGVLDALRANIPCVVLDVPHQWSAWTRRLLISADDILVVASPDLANLRNAKNIADLLKAARPNDHRPFYCLNQVGIPKKPEISTGDFAKALEDDPVVVIPFEPQLFGTAANNGQMIAEVSANHKTADMFRMLAQVLTGRAEVKRSRSGLLSLGLLGKIMKRKA